ncbi:TIGR00730 family Rossman fold protein [Enterococcus sp. BWB1-3]|uniref:LOG family protein n=1 Tax=Enterococcus sp. BWB1-3 TaxID=2787713 RepID=UPI001922A737|nr:TIGR00730 family Rossman fold protein [Enterococcus sp. BWB1-3]MBL1231053.1 TIGR00730 family Rossman fold protein [Enterococcus sp. BWB1-3]
MKRRKVLKRIAVYCGANKGNNPVYQEQAKKLGKWMVSQGYGLVYGGGNVGLMGIIADMVLQEGGEVIGVMPTFLVDREIAHPSLTELIVVKDMHERKKKMMDEADCYLALPGGPGTLEEISEAISWARVGEHAHPCVLLNPNGYYDLLADFFNHMVTEGFLSQEDRENILITESFDTIEEFIRNYQAMKVRSYKE